MGVKGLTSYVTHDAANFTQFHLHNTWVVIDAMNFIHFIYIDSGLSTQFNGEYVDLQLAIIKVLRVFRQCRIRPVFIFDGCHVVSMLTSRLLLSFLVERLISKLLSEQSCFQAVGKPSVGRKVKSASVACAN